MSARLEVARGLNSVAINLIRRVRRADQALGVPPARLSALSALVFGGPRSVSELASAEQVAGPTMSRIVDGLQRMGLAARHPHPTDARAVIVVPTDKGRRVMERGRRRREAEVRALLDGVGNEELECLVRAVAILRRVLSSSSDHASPPLP